MRQGGVVVRIAGRLNFPRRMSERGPIEDRWGPRDAGVGRCGGFSMASCTPWEPVAVFVAVVLAIFYVFVPVSSLLQAIEY